MKKQINSPIIIVSSPKSGSKISDDSNEWPIISSIT